MNKQQFSGILSTIQDGTGLVIESFRYLGDIPELNPKDIMQVGKYRQSREEYKAIYVQLIKKKGDLVIHVTVIKEDDQYEILPDTYEITEEGLKDLFTQLSTYQNKQQFSERAKGMLDFDVLLKDFQIYENTKNPGQFDIMDNRVHKEIAHNIKQITRCSTDIHVVFDIQCEEFMVLIIIDKMNGDVCDIRTIKQGDKEQLRKFKQFIENDNTTFMEYSKTSRIIF